MVDEIRDFRGLGQTAVVQGTDLVAIQAADAGPVQTTPLSRVIGRLGPVDEVVEAFADLTLDNDDGALALVWADPDPLKLGYWVKSGASGAGEWVYSNVFRGFSAYEVAVINGFVGDEAAWLASLQGSDGNDGAPGAAGTKYRWGGSIEGEVPGEATVLQRHVHQTAVTYADDFAGSVARLAPGAANPGANVVLTIKLNGVAVGTLTQLAAGGPPVWATAAGEVAAPAGSELRIETAGGIDAAMLGFSWTFSGSETA